MSHAEHLGYLDDLRARFRRHVSRSLRAWRKDHGITHEQLARHLNVSLSSVVRWEAMKDPGAELGRAGPRAHEIIAMETLAPGIAHRIIVNFKPPRLK